MAGLKLTNVRDAVIVGLAVKRLTRLAVDDAILEDFRQKVYERFPPETNKLGYLITCHACSSVWAGFVVATGLVPRPILVSLAMSEATLLAKAVEERLTTR